MKIGISSNAYVELGDVKERYKIASEMGFSAMDLDMEEWSVGEIYRGEMHGHFDQSVDELYEYYRGFCDEAVKDGISMWQAHAPFPSMRPQDEKMTEYIQMVFKKCIEVCEKLKCPYLVVHPVYFDEHRTWEEDLQGNVDYFSQYIDLLKKTGVVMCLENVYDVFRGRIVSFSASNADFLVLLAEKLNLLAGEECFGLCYDVGHANITGKDQFSEIMKFGSHLKTLHIHDTDGMHDTHLIPYTGRFLDRQSTDWEGVLKALAKIGYQGCINFECCGGGIKAFPKEVRTDAMRLTASIGKYFDAQIDRYRM